ncbi:MAG: ATP-binding protein [Nanoarchaeota archaeon]|nr:ATP-binding protein [Nanoarchaeota archaeon]
MYEIPQQLEYKEIIVFGLTFEQLAYALLFFPFIFSLLFKIDANIYVRIFLAMIPGFLAVGFMFFDLSTHIKNWYTWFKERNLETEEEIEKALELGVIKENLIYRDKKKIAVLRVEPINFSIKSQKEQETIIYSFQKFLNSIDFPIQILMTTETLDLDVYLDCLEKKVIDDKKKEIYESYKNHMKGLIEENSAMNRNFYVVIPETSDINIQIKLCEERLHSLNLRTTRLKDNGLRKMFMKLFNKEKINFLPDKIENSPDFLNIDGKFHKIIYAYGYPRLVEKGFLDRIVSCSGDFDFSLHITPKPIEQTLISLNKELQKQRADLYAAKLKNQLNPSLEIKYEDTRKILENLQKGNERLLNVSLYINCRADSLEDLNLLARKIESELNSLLIIPKIPTFRMMAGLKSCLPLAKNFLDINRNIPTSALSAFFPFTSSFFKFDETGIWFGLNKNNIPIIRDIFHLSNSNGICLASSGAGKSFMTKLFITRHLLNETKVIVIDPQGEYKGLVEKFNGQRINLSRDSETIINPLDLMGHDYMEKRLSLMDLMPIMLGDLTEPQKAFIDRAITEAYERKGIYMDDIDSWDNQPPILGDVLKSLEKMEKKAIQLEKNTLRSLTNRLGLYVNGVFSFLNRHTNINFNNKFVCFDIGNMPKQVKPPIMFLVLDYVYMKMKRDLERKILVIDEAWSLLSKTEEASYIFEIVKTCRKFNMGIFLINQEVEGMLNSEAGRSALANSSYTILLRQKPAVIDRVQKVFHLSDVERMALLTAGIGEGILLMEDEHSEIKIVASKEEYKQITTNADEILLDEVPKKISPRKLNIKVDETKRVHRSRNLSKDEKEYLIKKGFREESFRTITSKRRENYFVRPRFNETSTHLFVIYNIKHYLEEKGIKVELYVTRKPDIIFKIGKRKIAIEVETGSMLSQKKVFVEKVKSLNKNYSEWFFVVTNPNKVTDYKVYGPTIDVRYLRRQIDKMLK